MSFEILENRGHTVYAPLNTTIDADRDYGLAELEACACAGGAARTQMQFGGIKQPGSPGYTSADLHRSLGYGNCHPMDPTCVPPGLQGFYQDYQLSPGMLGDLEEAAIPAGVWMFGALAAGWALWAWYTPHQEVAY